MALTGRLDLTGINVRTEGEPIRTRSSRSCRASAARQDFSVVNVDFVAIEGRLVNGRVTTRSSTSRRPTRPTRAPLAAVRKANAVLDFPQLADLHALIRAISPPEPAGEAAQTATAPAPPRQPRRAVRGPT